MNNLYFRLQFYSRYDATYNYFGPILIAGNEQLLLCYFWLLAEKSSLLLFSSKCYSFQTFLVVEYERSKLTFLSLLFIIFQIQPFQYVSLFSGEWISYDNESLWKGIQGFNFLMSVPDECISRFSLERYRECFQTFSNPIVIIGFSPHSVNITGFHHNIHNFIL